MPKISQIFSAGYRVWLSLLVYYGSAIFALACFIVFLRQGQNLFFPVLGFALAGIILSFGLSRVFPDRFPFWFDVWKIVKRNPRSVLFFPPFSSFFMSLGVVLFVGNFFNTQLKEIWSFCLSMLPFVYLQLGVFIALPIFLIVAVLPAVLLLIYWPQKFQTKRYEKAFVIFIAIVYCLGMTYLFSYTITNQTGAVDLIGKAIEFFIGFIPLHWVYEILFGSIISKKIKEQFFIISK
ncbi:MAG: hypothetical protein Q7R99_00625 [bacterium]|nr:hypothetical protein [bacterium]